MIDQKEQETQSLQQIKIDTYTRVHARAHAWHASNTGITCYHHCIYHCLNCCGPYNSVNVFMYCILGLAVPVYI